MHKLSFPNGKDKFVQECVRIILECIYEPTFSNLSHGFRPNRSVHSALPQVELGVLLYGLLKTIFLHVLTKLTIVS